MEMTVIENVQDVSDRHIRRQLALAVETVDRLNTELSQRNQVLFEMVSQYTKLADVVRDYLADPHALTRNHLEFLLAKAPK